MSSKDLEEDGVRHRGLLRWTIVLSVWLHSMAYASLGPVSEAPAPRPRHTQLRFQIAEPATPPPAHPAEPQPKPEPPQPKLAKAREPPPASPAPPTQPAEAIAGVTLAAEGNGIGFSMPLGDGGALDPTRSAASPAPPVPAPARAPPAAPARSEPPLVAVGDLSARPSPPALGAALERNYPAEARRAGLSGSAKVRARIDADGVVRRVSLLEESGQGFGSACTRTLSGSHWAAPKDKAGRSVATEIRYTCRFVVQQ